MDGTHSFTYDAENRICSVQNGTITKYLYDAFGNRIAKGTDTSATVS